MDRATGQADVSHGRRCECVRLTYRRSNILWAWSGPPCRSRSVFPLGRTSDASWRESVVLIPEHAVASGGMTVDDTALRAHGQAHADAVLAGDGAALMDDFAE